MSSSNSRGRLRGHRSDSGLSDRNNGRSGSSSGRRSSGGNRRSWSGKIESTGVIARGEFRGGFRIGCGGSGLGRLGRRGIDDYRRESWRYSLTVNT